MFNTTLKKKLKQGEIIPLNMDFMFTNIFNKEENIDILEHFLAHYFEIPLNDIKGNITLLKRKLDVTNKKEATNEVDLVLKYKNKYINIELSNENKSSGIMARNVVFASKIHGKQLKRGNNDYLHISNTIQINLNNFMNSNGKIKNEYYFINSKDINDILDSHIRIDTVSLVIGKKEWYNGDDKSALARWCAIFLSQDEKELRKLLGEDFMEKDTSEKLVQEIDDLSSDDEYIELYTDLPRKEMEKNTLIGEAKLEGYNSGKNAGKHEEKIEIAKKMLNKNIDIDLIVQITGLTIDEIKTLK